MIEILNFFDPNNCQNKNKIQLRQIRQKYA
ncbi:MAG: hypothetical protein RLZ75_3117 [Pseudomonadota bacterium]|jgi:hypothetical protein